MANLTIKERFELDAPPDLVWSYLIDPARIVVCLPGAELAGQEDERTYLGAVKVKVGAVTAAYRGKVTFEEVDEAERFVRMVGKGREKSGTGTATMTMQSRVNALEGGRSEVTVESEVKLAGKIVRFGRGMIETVSAEIFKEFTSRLAKVLEEETAARTSTAGAADEAEGSPETTGVEERRDQAPAGDAIPLVPLLLRALRSWLKRIFGGKG